MTETIQPGPAPDTQRPSGQFPGQEEAEYHAWKFEELRRYSWRTMLTLPPLLVGLWAWDWVIDPVGAPGTLLLRIGMAACLLPCLLTVRSPRTTASRYTIQLYASLLGTQIFWITLLPRLDGGVIYGVGASLYYVLGTLVVGLPLRFRDNVLGLTLSVMLPNVAALAGWLPGFSLARYNVLMVPAGGLSLFAMWAFDRLYRRLFSNQRGMEALAGEDSLTGIPNRRAFMRAGEQMLEAVRRYERPASLLILDLDHFKSVNDRYGHASGDAVLRAVAMLLRAHQRGTDTVARLGGEEFAMLLPETDLPGAIALAERVRVACEEQKVELPGGLFAGVSVTLSIGAAECHWEDQSIDEVFQRADSALYRAKHEGRNRVAH